ncbi:MAG: hypothetical protein JJ976_15685 [Rhodothermales bacterium]|nr:hypothetical protein [Rhodothermales bacterium]
MQVHRQHRADSGPFLLQWLRDTLGCYVHATHRLDKPTAGLMLFALSREAASQIGMAFQERRARKCYLALVRGHPADGLIEYPLRPPRDNLDSRPDTAKAAVTDLRVLQISEIDRPVGRYQTARYALVELQPATGRRHQLRRHLKHIFHPIVGDRKYGDRDHNRFAESLGFTRLALVSTGLNIPSLDLSHACLPDSQWRAMGSALGLGLTPPLSVPPESC